jgi:hypothetical protein
VCPLRGAEAEPILGGVVDIEPYALMLSSYDAEARIYAARIVSISKERKIAHCEGMESYVDLFGWMPYNAYDILSMIHKYPNTPRHSKSESG